MLCASGAQSQTANRAISTGDERRRNPGASFGESARDAFADAALGTGN